MRSSRSQSLRGLLVGNEVRDTCWMEFRLLGPLEVVDDGRVLDLGGHPDGTLDWTPPEGKWVVRAEKGAGNRAQAIIYAFVQPPVIEVC